jgi:hypothetical protein
VWQLRHDALLHDFWQKQPFEERRQDLDPIPLAIDLLEKSERAQLPVNLTLDNYGEPYNPYFDLQWLCNLRDRAVEWRARQEQLPPGPPLREDAQRLLWKIKNQQGSLTADYANTVFWGAHNASVAQGPRKKPSGPLKRTLENLVKETSDNFKAVITAFKVDAMALRNAALGIVLDNILGELRDAGMAFVKIQDVDERSQRVYMQSLTGREMKPVSFKRVRNLLAEIKHPGITG